MKNLVIVESPTKARTIGRFLGDGYDIKASMGHIMDLPKSKLGVDTEHQFKPQYEMIKDKQKVVSELKTLAKTADMVILATDPDREGEAIAAHVKDVLSGPKEKFKRIVFHEITEEAVQNALQNPRAIDLHLVDAQTARRVLDRLVGYKLSPVLWQKVRRGLSAGRVQSVALRLIVEREREIENFQKEEYWSVHVVLTKDKIDTEFELIEINSEKIEIQKAFDLYDGEYKITRTSIENKEKAQHLLDDIKSKNFIVAEVLQKETRRSPQAPFTTSTLQQEAARRFGLSGRRTMGLAQRLYEEGLITYHRTDSVIVSSTAVTTIRNHIKEEYGNNYLPTKPRFYAAKQKLAQEAHEAIRPTKLNRDLKALEKELGRDYFKLYDLIFKRTVASQMNDALIESTTVFADSKDKQYRLRTNGSVLVFDGFLKVNPQALQDNRLPDFKASEDLELKDVNIEQHETLPPPRYNDASIIKTLEEKGIGRPSTYATIISTIEYRRYIEREESRFIPTSVGIAVNDFLVKNFSDIDDIPFTAEMEDGLDQIADGKLEWEPMIKSFYTPFSKQLDKVKEAERVKIEVEKTDEICPQCGASLVVRIGRFGKFLSCSTFPKCDFSKGFVEETNFTCPRDGAKIILKRTKKGRKFYGCFNYPKCDFAAWKIEDIKKTSGPNL